MNRFRLTIRRRNDGASAEFEANITLVDASGQDLIEIDERSGLRAGVGNLDSLNLLNWRVGVIDHGFSSLATTSRTRQSQPRASPRSRALARGFVSAAPTSLRRADTREFCRSVGSSRRI